MSVEAMGGKERDIGMTGTTNQPVRGFSSLMARLVRALEKAARDDDAVMKVVSKGAERRHDSKLRKAKAKAKAQLRDAERGDSAGSLARGDVPS